MSDSEKPNPAIAPMADETREAWRSPTLRVIVTTATASGTPDDFTELEYYETKPSG